MTTDKPSAGELPSPETMLAYASILEKPQYAIKNGVKFPIATGEIVEAACAALRHCAALRSPVAGAEVGVRDAIEKAIIAVESDSRTLLPDAEVLELLDQILAVAVPLSPPVAERAHAPSPEAVARMIEVCKNPPEPSENLKAMVREYGRFAGTPVAERGGSVLVKQAEITVRHLLETEKYTIEHMAPDHKPNEDDLPPFTLYSEAADIITRLLGVEERGGQSSRDAAAWHQCCETMMTLAGLSCGGSSSEMLAEFQAYVAERGGGNAVLDSYAEENQRFADRIEELESALAERGGGGAGGASSDRTWDVALAERVQQLEGAGCKTLTCAQVLGLIAFVRDGEWIAAPTPETGDGSDTRPERGEGS